MPRRKQLSDDAVLDAAATVMARKGPEFTLADVSAVTGISPSTLIQRFGDKHGLVVGAQARANARFAAILAEAPRAAGVEAVVDLFWSLTPGDDDEATLADQLQWLRQDLRDPELNALARTRRDQLLAAVAGRLPPLRLAPDAAARLLEAQWQGALHQWALEPRGALADYVADSLAAWFALAEAP
ncbi:TetR/AcrR family transcriptional regulator [Phenylobacterium sp.]|jgi:AcrR family transcriptional regulator|uniref:TetR/AcrR family transcriptional regulator n=1 Tax=Phenylobacterium sp. TaxID=1871053 RepID=UPI002F3F1994